MSAWFFLLLFFFLLFFFFGKLAAGGFTCNTPLRHLPPSSRSQTRRVQTHLCNNAAQQHKQQRRRRHLLPVAAGFLGTGEESGQVQTRSDAFDWLQGCRAAGAGGGGGGRRVEWEGRRLNGRVDSSTTCQRSNKTSLLHLVCVCVCVSGRLPRQRWMICQQ